jgi:hypothetical protein
MLAGRDAGHLNAGGAFDAGGGCWQLGRNGSVRTGSVYAGINYNETEL